MAIQHRRGAYKDFDAGKMLPGELAVTTDGTRKVYAAFAAGDVKELASEEEIEQTITGGIESISEKEREAVEKINTGMESIKSAGNTQANAINSAGTAQKKAVEDAGQEALNNIGTGVDSSLLQEGKAADAAATGKAVDELNRTIVHRFNIFANLLFA